LRIIDDAFAIFGMRDDGAEIVIEEPDHVFAVHDVAAGEDDTAVLRAVKAKGRAVVRFACFQPKAAAAGKPLQVSERGNVIEPNGRDNFF